MGWSGRALGSFDHIGVGCTLGTSECVRAEFLQHLKGHRVAMLQELTEREERSYQTSLRVFCEPPILPNTPRDPKQFKLGQERLRSCKLTAAWLSGIETSDLVIVVMSIGDAARGLNSTWNGEDVTVNNGIIINLYTDAVLLGERRANVLLNRIAAVEPLTMALAN
eukprot:6060868-Amphidinium_carterae.1